MLDFLSLLIVVLENATHLSVQFRKGNNLIWAPSAKQPCLFSLGNEIANFAMSFTHVGCPKFAMTQIPVTAMILHYLFLKWTPV